MNVPDAHMGRKADEEWEEGAQPRGPHAPSHFAQVKFLRETRRLLPP